MILDWDRKRTQDKPSAGVPKIQSEYEKPRDILRLLKIP